LEFGVWVWGSVAWAVGLQHPVCVQRAAAHYMARIITGWHCCNHTSNPKPPTTNPKPQAWIAPSSSTEHAQRCPGFNIWFWCLGVWCLVFGVWCLVFGVWCLVFGVWCLVFGVWCLVFDVWDLGCRADESASHQNFLSVVGD
jgi:hypothetical protein